MIAEKVADHNLDPCKNKSGLHFFKSSILCCRSGGVYAAGGETKRWKERIKILEAKKIRLVDTSSTFHKARCVLLYIEGEMATLRGSEICLVVVYRVFGAKGDRLL